MMRNGDARVLKNSANVVLPRARWSWRDTGWTCMADQSIHTR
jgi:hypothetical protein